MIANAKIIIDNKAQKLQNFALSVFSNPIYSRELINLLSVLNLSEKAVIEAYIKYDLDIFAYSNEIYDPLIMRMVLHIHNLLEGSWHIERQNTIKDFIQWIRPVSILDIGFGVPTLYIKEALIASTPKITLTDISESALIFAKILLNSWDVTWHTNITLLKEDMVETSLNPPEHDVYLFQDSIEHVVNPTECLQNFVSNTQNKAKFILSLPIGPITPIHYIAWKTDKEIKDWLKLSGLKVMKEKQIRVNPQVDLFAEQLHYDYTNMVLICEKIL